MTGNDFEKANRKQLKKVESYTDIVRELATRITKLEGEMFKLRAQITSLRKK